MSTWITWPGRLVSFIAWYTKEFILANVGVIADVLRPRARMKMKPGIVAVPSASRTPGEWMLIATLITLTPGTLTITFSREHGVLYVHGMFVETRQGLVDEIQEMEDRMLRGMRRIPGDLTRPSEVPVVRPGDYLEAQRERARAEAAGDGHESASNSEEGSER